MNRHFVRQAFWNAVRPFHSTLTKAARKRLGRNFPEHPEMELPPAYEAVQLEVERRLHNYLHRTAAAVEQIVIVGANDGSEIHRLRRSYPSSRFLCFEPSPQWFRKLRQEFREIAYVACREVALADVVGVATFHELPLAGNGSLLRPDQVRWCRFTRSMESGVTSFEVAVSTLDHEAATLNKIDLLWVDVQGAEARVLAGAVQTLPRVDAVFLEIALVDSPYEGAPRYAELDTILRGFGFLCVGLGVDGANYTGNALWVRPANLDEIKPAKK